MSLIVVPCPYCNQASRLDLSTLPDQPTYFPCPHCKERVGVHKASLMQQHGEPEAPAQAPAPEQPEPTDVELTAPEPPPEPKPAPAAAPAPIAADLGLSGPLLDEPPAASENKFGRIPADASFPGGIVLGDDEAGIELVREKLAILGSETERVNSAEEARRLVVEEQPGLCVFVASGTPSPPHAPLAALTGLAPDLRRGLFLVLVADELKTLDGNSAFMYQVDLIVNRQDLAEFGPALHSGLEYRKRLYRPFFEATG